MKRGRQMTAFEAGAPLRRQRRIRPSRVNRPNWKAESAETCLLRLERGKGCKALPIATLCTTNFTITLRDFYGTLMTYLAPVVMLFCTLLREKGHEKRGGCIMPLRICGRYGRSHTCGPPILPRPQRRVNEESGVF